MRYPSASGFLVSSLCLGLGMCLSPLSSQELPAPAEQTEPKLLPDSQQVEGLGAGWPAGQSLPAGEFPPIPATILSNLDLEQAV